MLPCGSVDKTFTIKELFKELFDRETVSSLLVSHSSLESNQLLIAKQSELAVSGYPGSSKLYPLLGTLLMIALGHQQAYAWVSL